MLLQSLNRLANPPVHAYAHYITCLTASVCRRSRLLLFHHCFASQDVSASHQQQRTNASESCELWFRRYLNGLIALLVLALLIAVLLVLTRPREVVIFPPALVQIHQFVRAMVTERDVDLPHAPVSVCGITQGDLHDSAHLAVGSRRIHPPCNLCAVAAYGANVQFTWASFIASSLIFIGLEASCSAAMVAKGRAQTFAHSRFNSERPARPRTVGREMCQRCAD